MYGIYANIGDILMVNVTIYSSTMDPMCDEKEHPLSQLISMQKSIEKPLPMTDPWCWYIYANIKGVY